MGIEVFFGILPRSVGEASNLPTFGRGGGQFARVWHLGWAILTMLAMPMMLTIQNESWLKT